MKSNPQIVPVAISQEPRVQGSGAGNRLFVQTHYPCSNPQIVPIAHSLEPIAKSALRLCVKNLLRDLRTLRGSSFVDHLNRD
ncbi:hypothetical protein JOD20_003958 [Herpetosiphon giganteus]|nr:hypothetical protein [Herpetosiphon giganteus]